MEFLVSEGMSEGTWPFLLKIFDKKISPISTSVECTIDTFHINYRDLFSRDVGIFNNSKVYKICNLFGIPDSD